MELKCQYSSLSCFLQLYDDINSNGSTVSKDYVFQDIEVLKLYYDILCKVEKDPFRYWNISSLRNYLKYFYRLSKYMAGVTKIAFNIYEECEFSIFFTGLYSKYKNKGCKEGLFIVCQRQDNTIGKCVKSYSDLRESGFNDRLDDIIIKSTFEEYYYLSFDGAPRKIREIENLSNFDYNNYKKDKETNKYIDTRLHILIDGVDNIPGDFFKILYGIDPNKYINLNYKKQVVLNSTKKKSKQQFLDYQRAMIEAIKKAIEKAKNDNMFNQLPLNFFNTKRKYQETPFQYLLPIDFTGTGNPDFCACIDVDKEGTGRLKTILNMNNEAYGNVRVFGKDAVESVKDWWV